VELKKNKSKELRDAFGMLWQGELDALKQVAEGCQIIVNIGAGVGTSGLAFREVAGESATIYTVDISEGGPTGGMENERTAFADTGMTLPIQILGDSAEVGRAWDKGQVDLVFVDGDHSPDSVRADIHAWLPWVKNGGIIVFHDYNDGVWQGVKGVVDELMVGYEPILHVENLIAYRVQSG